MPKSCVSEFTSSNSISIIVRTFNSSKTLGNVLAKLNITKRDELIVVDSGSTDNTLAISQRYGARIIRLQELFHYSKALNQGFEKVRTPWALVISSHCIPVTDKLLDRLRCFTASAPEECVVGYGHVGVVPPKATSNDAIVGNIENFSTGRFHVGGNGLAVYRMSAWREHPFDIQIDTAEDLEWFLWAIYKGYTALTIPGATATYLNQGSSSHMFRKGWLEVKRTRALVPRTRRNFVAAFFSLVVGYAYYVWLAVRLKISVATMFRQLAHALGAFLAEFSLNEGFASKDKRAFL